MKMAAVRAGAILVFLSVFPGSERVSGQRAPCYQCEDYKENHPQTSPYQQIRSHCSYPCECDDREPTCPPNVSVIRDGCGCCPICAGQLGQPCDSTSVCDDRKGLVCRYPYSGAAVGICRATTGLPCMVSNRTYSHGETFQTDCRTQCSCQNGTYACSSLCPNENISPRGACTHPRLVEVPDQCCREWMCDSTEAEHPPVCKQQFTSWSTCSADCGLGISQRESNLNQNCVLRNETRICQLRPCEIGMLSLEQHARHRHIRKGHECKATQRVRGPVRLRFGSCKSKKRYRPKFCGSCDDKAGSSGCCTPQLSTTIKVEFICNSVRPRDDPSDNLLDLVEHGRDLWWPDDLLALGKQEASRVPGEGSGTGKGAPHLGGRPEEKHDSNLLSAASDADMHLIRSEDELGEPLPGADVLIYETGYGEDRGGSDAGGAAGAAVVTTPPATAESKAVTSGAATEETAVDAATSTMTTSKPKKKRKKKPRKAFTSWLEFRDEEYQTDEYEDEEEVRGNRKRRSADGAEATPDRDGRGKRYSGSFREGFLEEPLDREEEYEDEDENDEDEYSDEEEDDEEEDEEEDSSEEEEDEQDTAKRSRSRRKPVLYAFYRRRRDVAPGRAEEKGTGFIPRGSAVGEREGGGERGAAHPSGVENPTSADGAPPRKRPKRQAEGASGGKGKLRKTKEKHPGGERKSGTVPSRERGGDSKSKRTPSGRKKAANLRSLTGDSGSKAFSHFRSKRHAPRPPWPARDDSGPEGLPPGDHSVSFSVQWIIKCHCSRDCGVDTTTFPSELNSIGEVVLRRIHRTSPP